MKLKGRELGLLVEGRGALLDLQSLRRLIIMIAMLGIV